MIDRREPAVSRDGAAVGPSAPRTPDLRGLLDSVRRGELSVDGALEAWLSWSPPPAPPARSLRIDHEREARCGFPEVVYGEGKTREELEEAARAIYRHHGRLLITRLDPETGEALWAKGSRNEGWRHGEFAARARCLWATREPVERVGRVAIVTAGTADVPIAEEARVAAEISGSAAHCYFDVGVAGVHRVLAIQEELRAARVVVVVAGMEGALPSVVAGLVAAPIIAVPTSVGYGASFSGLAPLLTMLNSCATGVSVVNIDNGFGAGMLASRINRLPPAKPSAT